MTSVFDSPYIRQRLNTIRQRDLEYDEQQTFGRCDCTSYSYFVLSMVLFSVGTVITVLSLGDADGFILKNLGHMWLVGPIFICSGMMVAVKSMLYLRRKSVIRMLLHQQDLLRDVTAAQAEQVHGSQMPRTASSTTLPPVYDALISNEADKSQKAYLDTPPPTYNEALSLIADDKNEQGKHGSHTVINSSQCSQVNVKPYTDLIP